MATIKTNIIKVKVYPKDLKSIPDILPYRLLLQGDPMELELDKMEIWRCMNFADVFDMTSGDEVHIDEESWAAIQEFVEDESTSDEPTPTPPTPDTGDDTEHETGKVNTSVTEETVVSR